MRRELFSLQIRRQANFFKRLSLLIEALWKSSVITNLSRRGGVVSKHDNYKANPLNCLPDINIYNWWSSPINIRVEACCLFKTSRAFAGLKRCGATLSATYRTSFG